MTKKTYTTSNIKLLKGLEPIKQNPGMFIGELSNPTHLLTEVFDNAMDEVINKYADSVAVTYNTEDHKYSIYDNGRGVPLGKKEGFEIPILISSHLFSGGKYDTDGYDISVGLHGIGLAAVNALSDWYEIEIYRDGYHYKATFKESKLVDELKEKSNSHPFSTKISFIPSKSYFLSQESDIKIFKQRMNFTSLFIKNAKQFAFYVDNMKWVPEESNQTILLDMFGLNKEKYEKNSITDVYEISISNIKQKITTQTNKTETEEIQSVDIKFFYTNDNTRDIKGSVNLLPCHQGTHINMLQRVLNECIYEYRNNNDSYKKDDCTVGIKALISINKPHKEFTSQTKEKFSVSKIHLKNMEEEIRKQIKKNIKDKIIDIESIKDKINQYRRSLTKTKKIVKRESRVRGMSSKNSKLVDCTKVSSLGTEVFLVEGDSASGTAKQARDSKTQAILPLKGKVLNVYSSSFEKIMNNKEMIDILTSIGVDPKNNTTDDLRYEKIILLTDADADGKHIASLLLGAFMKFAPNVINEGHLYYCDLPLYGQNRREPFGFMWTEEERIEYQKNNPDKDILRFKGLAEMSSDQLYEAAFNSKSRKLIRITPSKAVNYISKVLTSPEEKWKLITNEVQDIIKDLLEEKD